MPPALGLFTESKADSTDTFLMNPTVGGRPALTPSSIVVPQDLGVY